LLDFGRQVHDVAPRGVYVDFDGAHDAIQFDDFTAGLPRRTQPGARQSPSSPAGRCGSQSSPECRPSA
jgi:hypothetical protein